MKNTIFTVKEFEGDIIVLPQTMCGLLEWGPPMRWTSFSPENKVVDLGGGYLMFLSPYRRTKFLRKVEVKGVKVVHPVYWVELPYSIQRRATKVRAILRNS